MGRVGDILNYKRKRLLGSLCQHDFTFILPQKLNFKYTSNPCVQSRSLSISAEMRSFILPSIISLNDSGLFQFIRYIEAIQKAEMDFAGADVVFGEGDAVTMMTIHKSKGLEFPIVILADCAHQINDQDSKSPVHMDDELGIGLERRDVNTRIKKKTLMMETIRARKKRNLYAEEIRLLYVAMSRAKEKLILTGAMSIPQTKLNLWAFSKAEPDSASIL